MDSLAAHLVRVSVVITVAGASLLGAVAHASAPDVAHAGFQAGEGFVYTFSVGAIDAGRARIAVGQPVRTNGKRLVAVQADAHSAPWLALLARLEDTYKVVLDADTLHFSSVESEARGFREHHVKLLLDGQKVFIDFQNPKIKSKGTHTIVKAPVDLIGALFKVRAAPLQDGDKFEMFVFDGAALYKSLITTVGREQLAYEGHKVQSIHVDITATRVDDTGRALGMPLRHGQIWMTDDEQRVPFKALGDTDLGACDVDLVAYQRAPIVRHRADASRRLATTKTNAAVPPAPADHLAPAVVEAHLPRAPVAPPSTLSPPAVTDAAR